MKQNENWFLIMTLSVQVQALIWNSCVNFLTNASELTEFTQTTLRIKIAYTEI